MHEVQEHEKRWLTNREKAINIQKRINFSHPKVFFSIHVYVGYDSTNVVKKVRPRFLF